MANLHINVTVAPGQAHGLQGVASELQTRGMQVESVLESIGIITGTVADTGLEALRAVPGVNVEPDQAVQLPPPGAPLQ